MSRCCLLIEVSQGFTPFDYLNTPEATIMFNIVRSNVRLQLSYIERAYNIQGEHLQRWWDLWSNAYFARVESMAQEWLENAIDEAGAPFVDAQNRGIHLRQAAGVLNTLRTWETQRTTRARLPPNTVMPLPNLGDETGGSGTAGTGNDGSNSGT